MKGSLRIGEVETTFEWEQGVDLSVSARPYDEKEEYRPQAFGLPRATADPVRFGDFSAAVDDGASINCPVLHICAHSNGTHTECAGHVLPGRHTLGEAKLGNVFVSAVLISVEGGCSGDSDDYPTFVEGDGLISARMVREALEKSIPESFRDFRSWGAVIVRTLPNEDGKRERQWTGTNPAYLSGLAMCVFREMGMAHVLVDLPSVDKEDDGGYLVAHRTFFGVDPYGRHIKDGPIALKPSDVPPLEDPSSIPPIPPRTITELAFVPDTMPDGVYALSLQIAPVEADAAPSRPILFPLNF